MVIFDDSYQHEACNMHQKEDRAILLFDIWHPDLHKLEIEAIQNMFGEVENMQKNRTS